MISNKPFKMLCIDASTSHFGFAEYVNGELVDVSKTDFGDVYSINKLEKMFKFFEILFRSRACNHIVLEQPVPLQFSRAVVQINQVVGMILATAFQQGITTDFVHNRTAKRLLGVTERGKLGKAQGIEIVKKLYPQFADQIVNDHIADAVIVGEAYKKLMIEKSSTDTISATDLWRGIQFLKDNSEKNSR